MSKFYYQDRPYEVPSTKYRDTDTVVRALKCVTPCNCVYLVDGPSCEGVFCWDCIFSSHNPEARLEYLKVKGIVKTENNDTMPELKGGMLVKIDNDWVLTSCSSEGYVVTYAPNADPKLSNGTSICHDKISEVYYDKGFNGTKSLCVCDIQSIMAGTADLTQPLYENIAVWKRPDPVKEMTMSDLEKHFGCRVKIVKDN